MKNNVLLIFMILVAVFFFYRMEQEHQLNKMLREESQLADSLIVVKDNMVAQLGQINSKLQVKNKELRGVSNHLKLKVDKYIKILQKIKTSGKTNLRPDTIIVYKNGDSTSYRIRRFNLISQDSAIYADGYVTKDSIYADSMGAKIRLFGYFGTNPAGQPWFLVRSPNPTVKITTDFQYVPPNKRHLHLSGGIFLDDKPGVLGAVRYNTWSVGVGVKTNGKKILTVMKEVTF